MKTTFKKDDVIRTESGIHKCIIADKSNAVFGEVTQRSGKTTTVSFENLFIVSNRVSEVGFEHEKVNLDEVAVRYPELKFVICHMGSEQYKTAVHLMCKHRNVYGDISALARHADWARSMTPKYLPFVHFPYYSYLEPLLYYFSRTGAIGGTDKIIWGSDWVGGDGTCVKSELDAVSKVNPELKKLGLPEIPEPSLHNILHENWKKLFKL